MAWNDAVVTNAGIALLRQVLSGETLTLDGAAGGTGTVSSASLMAQTALKDKKQTFSIVGMTNVDNGKKINLQVSNLNLETGYTLNQVGIWAHVGTGEPVLYAILQDPTGITIPSKTEMQDFAMNLYAVIDFGNDVSVNLTIDSTALVTRATLDEELNKKLDKGGLGELAYKSKAEKTDLSDDVQSSLDKADTAVQTETDPTVPSWAKKPTKPSYSYGEIKDKPSSYTPSSHNHSANEINSGTFTIARGGTGANTAEGARTNLGAIGQAELDALDALGMETGSNANGHYIRFSNGIQICYQRRLSVDGVYPHGESSTYIPFPAKFINENYINIISDDGSIGSVINDQNVGATSLRVIAKNTDDSSHDMRFNYVSIGRWK